MIRILVKQFSTLIIASGISAGAGLLTLSLNARSLGIENFGALSLILAYTALFGGISTFDTWQSVVRVGMKAPRVLGLALSAGILLDTSAALFATVAAIGASVALAHWTNIPSEYLWLAQLHALSLLGGVAGTPKGYFRLTERFDVLAGNQIALALAMAVASTALWWTEAGLATYVITFALISFTYNMTLMLRMLWMLRGSRVRLRLPFASPRAARVSKMMLSSAVGTSIFSTLNSNRNNLVLLLSGVFLGGSAAGVVSAAMRIAAQFSKLANLAQQVLFKAVLQAAGANSPKQWRTKILRVTAISGLAAGLIAGVGMPLGSLAIELFLGAAYAGSASVFAGLFAAECANFAVLHLNPVIQQKGGPRPLIGVAAAGLVIHLVGMVLLAPAWGATAAGLASLLASISTAVVMTITADLMLRRAIAKGESTSG